MFMVSYIRKVLKCIQITDNSINFYLPQSWLQQAFLTTWVVFEVASHFVYFQ